MVSCFIARLKEEIGLRVQMFRPTSLIAAASLAWLQEEKNMATRKVHRPENFRFGASSSNLAARNQ